MFSPKDKNDSQGLSDEQKSDTKEINDESGASISPASQIKPDTSFEDSCDVTPPDNETLDSSALEDTSASATGGGEKETFFKWLSRSPQMIFKRIKAPKEIAKSPKSGPRCSSEVEIEAIRNSSGFEKLSPIQREENPKKDKTSTNRSLFNRNKVDRIDYANIADDCMIPTFLSSRICYDVMPTSGKVVVLSSELLVKNAFEALVNNELRAAPLWNTNTGIYVGMLTISDFINILRHYYRNSPENIKDIESQAIETWKKMNKPQKPVAVTATNHLAYATKVLIEEGVHRIPVLDEARHSVLFVLTRKRLLHYIYYNIIEKFGKSISRTPSFLTKSIRELGVGTFEDIATVTYKTTVTEALDLFMQRKVSALPIVDENNAVLDIFAKFDVFALAKEQSYHNLDITIEDAIEKGKAFIKVHEDVYGISLDDTLGTVIQSIVTSKAHRLVVIDEKKVPIGMVSLSDILKYIVVQPLAGMDEQSSAAADTIEEAPEGAVGGAENEDVFLNAKQKSGDDLEITPDAQESAAEEDTAESKEDSSVETENAPE